MNEYPKQWNTSYHFQKGSKRPFFFQGIYFRLSAEKLNMKTPSQQNLRNYGHHHRENTMNCFECLVCASIHKV